MMGDSPRIPYYQGLRDVWERPNILFVCREDATGNFVVEDDVHEDEAPSWAGYFGMQRLESHPGETYPHNLQEILDAEEEADRIMGQVGIISEEDVDDLFEHLTARDEDELV